MFTSWETDRMDPVAGYAVIWEIVYSNQLSNHKQESIEAVKKLGIDQAL